MKNLIRWSLVGSFMFIALPTIAQITAKQVQESGLPQGTHRIEAHDLLWKQEAALNQYAAEHPEVLKQNGLKKTSAWGFSVGSTKSWYADDLTGSTRYLVPSTCRAVGVNCYVFVEDANWGTRVTQAAVDSVVKAFDASTPANPSKGIYQTDVDAFGNPPDVDSDPRIIILILDIKDGFTGSGGFVVGYFYGYNEYPANGSTPTSNVAEIYFLDCNPLNLATTGGVQEGMSTTAHEFQHMIHWNYNKLSDTFTNEGCSLIAEVNAGYPIYAQYLWASEPNHALFDWRRTDANLVLNDYSRASRYFEYYREQFGIGIFKRIVQTNLTGSTRLNTALTDYVPTTSRRFSDIFKDWTVANYLNDTSVDPKWGYTYPGLGTANPKIFQSPVVSSTQETIAALGADYLSFRGGTSLTLNVTSNAADGMEYYQVIESGPAGKRVLTTAAGSPFSEPGLGTSYTDVTLLAANLSESATFDMTYSATGSGASSVELKWDLTEPTGYLQNAATDTVAVTFDGVPGARLDSIRVALRRLPAISGRVYASTGVVRPSPLGTPLSNTFTVSGITTPGVPYPVPWTNWVTANVRTQNISAVNPFVVAFVCADVYNVGNRVMTTVGPTSAGVHSYTYSSTSASGANWYYFTSNTAGDSAYIYLIRAYVSFGPLSAPETRELLPTSVKLDQNYPNPFNPSTTISFSLPKAEFVTLKIYDLLGREVTTLVNETQQSGPHSVQWNPGALASGTYVYRLQAGTTTETKKLVLIK